MPHPKRIDSAANRLTLAAAWGLPAGTMLLAMLLPTTPRAAVWIAML